MFYIYKDLYNKLINFINIYICLLCRRACVGPQSKRAIQPSGGQILHIEVSCVKVTLHTLFFYICFIQHKFFSFLDAETQSFNSLAVANPKFLFSSFPRTLVWF
jgi:hypothetical protein